MTSLKPDFALTAHALRIMETDFTVLFPVSVRAVLGPGIRFILELPEDKRTSNVVPLDILRIENYQTIWRVASDDELLIHESKTYMTPQRLAAALRNTINYACRD